jgi:hypothetical protein
MDAPRYFREERKGSKFAYKLTFKLLKNISE